jgi:hypothetical protein
MGHASDCAVNDGPAFLPGPCDCGLDLSVDPAKLFRPLLILGTRGARWEIKQANVEALIEAEETPIGDGRRITLTIDLVSTHGWPPCGRDTNGMDFNDSLAAVIV